MAIKINNPANGTTVPTRRTDTPSRQSPVSVSTNQGATAGGDRVTLTGAALNLQSILASLEDTPVVDSARVAQLRSALQEGSYQVDATRIADKLMAFENEL